MAHLVPCNISIVGIVPDGKQNVCQENQRQQEDHDLFFGVQSTISDDFGRVSASKEEREELTRTIRTKVEDGEGDHEDGKDPNAEEDFVGDMEEEALEECRSEHDPVLEEQEEASKEVKVKASVTQKVWHPGCVQDSGDERMFDGGFATVEPVAKWFTSQPIFIDLGDSSEKIDQTLCSSHQDQHPSRHGFGSDGRRKEGVDGEIVVSREEDHEETKDLDEVKVVEVQGRIEVDDVKEAKEESYGHEAIQKAD